MNSCVKTGVHSLCNAQKHKKIFKCLCFTNPASRNSVEDDYYEDADNNYPTTRINGAPKSSCEDFYCFFLMFGI